MNHASSQSAVVPLSCGAHKKLLSEIPNQWGDAGVPVLFLTHVGVELSLLMMILAVLSSGTGLLTWLVVMVDQSKVTSV